MLFTQIVHLHKHFFDLFFLGQITGSVEMRIIFQLRQSESEESFHALEKSRRLSAEKQLLGLFNSRQCFSRVIQSLFDEGLGILGLHQLGLDAIKSVLFRLPFTPEIMSILRIFRKNAKLQMEKSARVTSPKATLTFLLFGLLEHSEPE